MTAAMHLPFVVLFPLLWRGVLAAGTLFLAGHVLMLPVMAAVMLQRPDEYTQNTEARAVKNQGDTRETEHPGGRHHDR